MKTANLLSRLLFVLPIFGLSATAFAQQGQPIAGYKLLSTIAIPGGFRANDISWIDSSSARLYLADRGDATASPPVLPRIDIFDTENRQFLTSITVSAATDGVVAVPRSHEVWVGLADSTVIVLNTDTNTIAHVISTGGKGRADEMAYDPADRLILIANDKDSPPFVSLISTQSYSVVKSVAFNGSSAPQATNGIELPVWDGPAGKFYISIPATKTNPNGEVDEMDPQTAIVTRSFPTVCKSPKGMVLAPGQRLVLSCGDVIDILSGNVVTTINGVGGDEVWYNPGDQRIYFGGGTDNITVNVVDANSYALLTSLVVGQNLAAPAVSATTKSVTVDAGNNQIFVPVTGVGAGVGVQVWRNGATFTALPNPIPAGGSIVGTALITWNAPNAQAVEVHVGSPGGPLFARAGNRGSQFTGPWVSEGMVFYLQDITGGLPVTSANTIATLTVHLQ